MATKVRPSLAKRALGAPEFWGSKRKKKTIYRGVDSFLDPGAGISVRGITTPPGLCSYTSEQLLLGANTTHIQN